LDDGVTIPSSEEFTVEDSGDKIQHGVSLHSSAPGGIFRTQLKLLKYVSPLSFCSSLFSFFVCPLSRHALSKKRSLWLLQQGQQVSACKVSLGLFPDGDGHHSLLLNDDAAWPEHQIMSDKLVGEHGARLLTKAHHATPHHTTHDANTQTHSSYSTHTIQYTQVALKWINCRKPKPAKGEPKPAKGGGGQGGPAKGGGGQGGQGESVLDLYPELGGLTLS
jgi:hypothetical protein